MELTIILKSSTAAMCFSITVADAVKPEPIRGTNICLFVLCHLTILPLLNLCFVMLHSSIFFTGV